MQSILRILILFILKQIHQFSFKEKNISLGGLRKMANAKGTGRLIEVKAIKQKNPQPNFTTGRLL